MRTNVSLTCIISGGLRAEACYMRTNKLPVTTNFETVYYNDQFKYNYYSSSSTQYLSLATTIGINYNQTFTITNWIITLN